MDAIHTTTAQRLSTLARLYEQGQASDLMDRTLNKLFAQEAAEARAQLSVLESDLSEFEELYGMESAEFFRRYQSGQTDDRMDFVEWASLIHMKDNLLHRLTLLDAAEL